MKKIFAMLLAVMCVVSLAACDMSGAIVYDLGNVDRANYFQTYYDNLVDQYGKAKVESDDTYGNVLTGVAVARLLDFTGDGIYELYVAYADGTTPYVNRQMVVGFEYGSATLLDEEITSKATADDKAPTICLYTDDSNRAYIVKGEDMSASADYTTYVQTRGEEKIYAFETEFTEQDGTELAGTYERISLADFTDEDSKLVFDENDKVTDSIKGQAK